MPRSPDEKAALARKYGRRRRVLRAASSADALDAIAREMLTQLRGMGLAKTQLAALEQGLRFTDVKRRDAAVWALVAALEAAER